METFDFVVVGGGVIGTSIACHLAMLGAGRVALVERGTLGSGTTAQSSCILRTHYSVREDAELAHASIGIFRRLPDYLDDPEAASGYNRCGLLIVAPAGERAEALAQTLATERSLGIEARDLTPAEARERLPLLNVDDIAHAGFEPDAGYADAHLTLSSFAKAARRRGVRIVEGVTVTGLRRAPDGRVIGVRTDRGDIAAGRTIVALNIWTGLCERWTGVALPLTMSRHAVFTLEGSTPYTRDLPVLKDLASPAKLYLRSYATRQLLVGDGNEGQTLAAPDTEQADVPLDHVVELGEQVAHRLPAFADAGLASSWTGVYDVTPDWNPVLGPLPGIDGLDVAYGFSGHGFKLSPIVGRLMAQHALGLATDLPLAPYALGRFASGKLLTGRYGAGAVS
jgi:glycine/D-amino acid oxidase-like deaminating enzyme